MHSFTQALWKTLLRRKWAMIGVFALVGLSAWAINISLKANQNPGELAKDLVNVILFLLIGLVIGFLLAAFLYFCYGKDDRGETLYVREAPEDLAPGFLPGILLQRNTWSPTVISSTLLRFCMEGYYSLERNEQGTYLRRTLQLDQTHDWAAEHGLQPYETLLLKIFHLLEEPVQIDTDTEDTSGVIYPWKIKERAAGKNLNMSGVRNLFVDDYNKFVETRCQSIGVFIYWSLVALVAVVAALALFAAWKVLAVVHGAFIVAAGELHTGMIATGILMILLCLDRSALVKYHRDYLPTAQAWGGYYRFLKDFPRMQDKTMSSLPMWQDLLVYAAALGLTDTIKASAEGQMSKELANMASMVSSDDIADISAIAMEIGFDFIAYGGADFLMNGGGELIADGIGSVGGDILDVGGSFAGDLLESIFDF